MNAVIGQDLRSLRDRPFDLLRELERRSKTALAGVAGDDVSVEEWVGVGFRLGEEQFVVARDKVREIMMVPDHVTRVPGAKDWVTGLANIRGQLLPIVDLKSFLGVGAGLGQRSARVMVANSAAAPVGLVVDGVFGFRRFLASEYDGGTPETILRGEQYLGGSYVRGKNVWPVFNMDALLASEAFKRAALG